MRGKISAHDSDHDEVGFLSGLAHSAVDINGQTLIQSRPWKTKMNLNDNRGPKQESVAKTILLNLETLYSFASSSQKY